MTKQFATIHEEARDIPVIGEYDVVVVGGGMAGVASALAASRVSGTKVCLLEKFCGLGGLATLGVVIVYLPLCDGRGHQIIGGIGEELLRLSVDDVKEDNPDLYLETIPKCWEPGGDIAERCEKRFRTGFNPITYMYKLERLMLKNRIQILYDTRFANVVKENGAIQAVLVETKAGRAAIKCKAVVDCSGDADVCTAAGEKVVSIAKNVRSGWYYYINADKHLQIRLLSDAMHTPPIGPNGKPYSFRGDNSFDVTKQVIASRQLMMDDMAKIRAAKGGDPFPVMSPMMPTFRMTRRLAGKVTLKESDDHRWFEDTLGMTGDWRKAGPIFCIPLRCLAAVNTSNLITAGRCIASTGDTWDLTRVIPTCVVTGEAAGVAAAFLANSQDCRSFKDLDITAMQKYIRRHKGIIDKSLLKN